MPLSPAFVKKAASLLVVPCRENVYHVGRNGSWHTVTMSRIGGNICTCEAALHGKRCTHVFAVTSQLQSNSGTTPQKEN